MQKRNLAIILALLPLCAHSEVAAQGENANPNSDLPQQYSATAFGQAGAAAGKSFSLDVYVTRWTSDGEIAATLKNKGPNGR